ncbi:hypothetical protein WDW89_01555 [Deltaproteobacteria bacterium TL4]
MAHFTDKIFSFEKAYSFEKMTGKKNYEQLLWEELLFQLEDLENMWFNLFNGTPEGLFPLSPEQQYQCSLEQLLFRLKEILRFIDQYSGPKIVRFICSEIRDLIQEKRIIATPFNDNEIKRVNLVLAALNANFQPAMVQLQLSTVKEISHKLKEVMQPLLKREL